MIRSIVVAALLATAGASFAQTRWTLANEYPASSLPGEADTFFATAVAARSQGRLTIETLFDSKTGLRTKDQLQAVASNAVQMASSFGGAMADEHPLLLLSSLPFFTATAADARKLFAA